jgi:Protein of unknown function (DUF1778)
MSSNLRAERLDIPLSPTEKRLLQAAAQSRHKTLSEFVLDTALTEAEMTGIPGTDASPYSSDKSWHTTTIHSSSSGKIPNFPAELQGQHLDRSCGDT